MSRADDRFSEQNNIIARQYWNATGIPCSIARLTEDSAEPLPCMLCTLPGDDAPRIPCGRDHQYGAIQSERFGGSYVYLCPASLFFWTSPIIIDGSMKRAFIAGPVLSLDPADIIDELAGKDLQIPKHFGSLLEEVPVRSVTVIHSLSELLRMCAGWASGYQENRMVENRLIEQQQAHLSEYIHELKLRKQTDGAGVRLVAEQRLQQAVRHGDRISARQLLDELLGHYRITSGNSVEQTRFYALELIILLSRSALQGGAEEEEAAESSLTFQREISRITSLEGIARKLQVVLEQFITLVLSAAASTGTHRKAVQKAVHYLHHRCTEQVSLQETAEYAGMHPSYFSKIFNEETGSSFSSFLNSLRCERAKYLLKYTRYTLVDIAGMSGFNDQSYFSRVFKIHTGSSPGAYRHKAGRYPENNYEIHAVPEIKDINS